MYVAIMYELFKFRFLQTFYVCIMYTYTIFIKTVPAGDIKMQQKQQMEE